MEQQILLEHRAFGDRVSVVNNGNPRILRLRCTMVPTGGVWFRARGTLQDFALGIPELLLHLRLVRNQPELAVPCGKHELVIFDVVKRNSKGRVYRWVLRVGSIRGLGTSQLVRGRMPNQPSLR